MSALARFFNNASVMVVGYDKTPSPLTHTLIDEGIEISFIDDVVSIPSIILENKVESLVVYTPAIPRDNKIFNFFPKLINSNKNCLIIEFFENDGNF